MKHRTEFWEAFLRGAGPSAELLAAFALGLLVVGLLANLVYDLLTVPGEAFPAAWAPALAITACIALAYLLFHLDRRRGRVLRADVDEGRLAPPHAGLIWLFGPGRFDHLLFALHHHQRDGGAAHCWLVMQNIEPVSQAYAQLAQRLPEEGLATQLHPVYVDQLDVQSAYQAVQAVLERESVEEGLHPHQVIADITGGTKPMTAGMVLAALTTGGTLEYVESQRDALGQPIEGSLSVVLVDTSFYLAREE